MTPRTVSILIATALVLLGSSVALGDAGTSADTDTAAQQIVDIVFDVLKVVLTALLGYVSLRVGKWFEQKTGVDIPARQEEQMERWISQGVIWAEEKSRSKIKEAAKKLSGPEKLELATKFVLDMAHTQGWVKWTEEKVAAKIEAWLGNSRIGDGKPRLDGEDSPDLPGGE